MRELNRTSRKWNSTTLLFLIVVLLLNGCQDAESKRQMSALRQLALDMPIYATFKQVSSYDNNKVGDAILIICYNSPANWEDVSRFYSQTLLAKGWIVVPEVQRGRSAVFHSDGKPEFVFRNGEYQIGIRSAQNDSTGCIYMITYYWERG